MPCCSLLGSWVGPFWLAAPLHLAGCLLLREAQCLLVRQLRGEWSLEYVIGVAAWGWDTGEPRTSRARHK